MTASDRQLPRRRAPPIVRHLPPASEAYRSQAGDYDQRTDAFRHWRELLVQQLPIRRGDTVLDVGCGTGLCLPLLQHKVGPTGAIIGIDASEQMLQVAADRIAAARLGQRPPDRRPGRRPRRSTPSRTPPCSARYTTSCNPVPRWATCSTTCAPARRSPRPAANGRPRGCGRCEPGSPSCTHRSSPTSPASTDRGDNWPNTSPTCGSENSPSAPVTSPSATPTGR